jgi:DNA-binding response OmpR family regulator
MENKMKQNKLLLIGCGNMGTMLATLNQEGWHVTTAQDNAGIVDVLRQEDPDIIVYDIMPQTSACLTCRDLRQVTNAPIILIADDPDPEIMIKNLDMGADGYITRPFSYRELMARIKALQRRVEMQTTAPAPSAESFIFRAGDLVIDLSSYQVTYGGAPVKLSRIEFNLLSFLIRFRGSVFTREQLLEKLWGNDYIGDTRTIDTHIWSLRQKIEIEPAKAKHLVAVRGVGYKFE